MTVCRSLKVFCWSPAPNPYGKIGRWDWLICIWNVQIRFQKFKAIIRLNPRVSFKVWGPFRISFHPLPQGDCFFTSLLYIPAKYFFVEFFNYFPWYILIVTGILPLSSSFSLPILPSHQISSGGLHFSNSYKFYILQFRCIVALVDIDKGIKSSAILSRYI